jgi:hypothetical protein
MECDKNVLEIINLDKFNELINEYNEEENGEFTDFLTKCPTTGGSTKRGNMKGGAPGDTKLNKYFFTILRCLIFSVGTAEFFRSLVFLLPVEIIHELSIGFLKLLRLLLIGGCQIQIPIITDMCPMYKDLFIEFLNNMEIILIKLGPVMKNGIKLWISANSMKDIYNDSKIFYYLLNNPEFIDDVEYPVGTVFIVNKNNYPVDFVQQINTTINGDKQPNYFGTLNEDTSDMKNIPTGIKKMTYSNRRTIPIAEDIFITSNEQRIYLHPVYTRFYINIGYLTVEYITDDEAKKLITDSIKNYEEKIKLLAIIEQNNTRLPENVIIDKITELLGYDSNTQLTKRNKTPSRGGKNKTKQKKNNRTSKKNLKIKKQKATQKRKNKC